MSREPVPSTDGTRPVEHTFTFTAPESVVPGGRYTVEATVVSGVGDGCPPSSEGEDEHADTVKKELQLP
jgi:hypothetical protein